MLKNMFTSLVTIFLFASSTLPSWSFQTNLIDWKDISLDPNNIDDVYSDAGVNTKQQMYQGLWIHAATLSNLVKKTRRRFVRKRFHDRFYDEITMLPGVDAEWNYQNKTENEMLEYIEGQLVNLIHHLQQALIYEGSFRGHSRGKVFVIELMLIKAHVTSFKASLQYTEYEFGFFSMTSFRNHLPTRRAGHSTTLTHKQRDHYVYSTIKELLMTLLNAQNYFYQESKTFVSL